MAGREWVSFVIPLVVLGVNIPVDIRRRQIYPRLTVAAWLIGFICIPVLYADLPLSEIFVYLLMASVPGLCMLCLARMTKEKVGYGDGMMTWMMGIWVGAGTAWLSLAAACIYICLIGTVMKKKEVPFIPYLAAGFVTSVLFQHT